MTLRWESVQSTHSNPEESKSRSKSEVPGDDWQKFANLRLHHGPRRRFLREHHDVRVRGIDVLVYPPQKG